MPSIEDAVGLYAVLDDDKASYKAAIETLRDLVRVSKQSKTKGIAWARFGRNGKMLQGGVSSINGGAHQPVWRADEEPSLRTMSRIVESGGGTAGEIVYDEPRSEFHWFVPTNANGHEEIDKWDTLGLVVEETIFRTVIAHLNSALGLTTAELRLAFQLVAGQRLAEAAASDDVGIETKRSHLKSLTAKFECSGQIQLMRILLGQCFILANFADRTRMIHKTTEVFVTRHLPETVSLGFRKLGGSDVIRILDIGPTEGKPVVLIHGLIFVPPIVEATRVLTELNLRVLMPIRAGYLEGPMFEAGAAPDKTSRSIDMLQRYIATAFGRAVPVVGHSLGSGVAIELAARHPDLVSHLALVSAHAGPGRSLAQSQTGFMASLSRFLVDSRSASVIGAQFAKLYTRPEMARRALNSMFGTSPSDRTVLDRFGPRNDGFWFSDVFTSSVNGIVNDFRFSPTEQTIPPELPVRFIHGTHDNLTLPTDIADRARKMGGEAEFLDGGNLLAASHAAAVWASIADLMVSREVAQ